MYPYKFEICDKFFLTKDNLIEHITSVIFFFFSNATQKNSGDFTMKGKSTNVRFVTKSFSELCQSQKFRTFCSIHEGKKTLMSDLYQILFSKRKVK